MLNDKITGITPAMPTGSCLSAMMNEMPERTFDVGIAEQHACHIPLPDCFTGEIPYCIIYSTFFQRAL